MDLSEILKNVAFILLAALGGAVFGLIVQANREKGPRIGAMICALIALTYLLSPRTKLEVDAEEPFLLVVRKNLISKQVTACQWRTYDKVGDLRLTGWCAKDKDGNWYRFLRAPDE